MTVTVYTPALPVQEREEVPVLETLVGVRAHVRPVLGETVVVRLTTPLKPCNAVIVIVEVPAVPALAKTPIGVAARAQSCTV